MTNEVQKKKTKAEQNRKKEANLCEEKYVCLFVGAIANLSEWNIFFTFLLWIYCCYLSNRSWEISYLIVLFRMSTVGKYSKLKILKIVWYGHDCWMSPFHSFQWIELDDSLKSVDFCALGMGNGQWAYIFERNIFILLWFGFVWQIKLCTSTQKILLKRETNWERDDRLKWTLCERRCLFRSLSHLSGSLNWENSSNLSHTQSANK